MGLLKKKSQDNALPEPVEDQPATGAAEPEDDGAGLTEALFAGPAGATDDAAANAADDDATVDAAEAPEEPASPAAVQTIEIKEDASDALLNVFESTQSDMEDRSLLLEIVGDVDIASLSEELRTTASALGIVRARRRTEEAA